MLLFFSCCYKTRRIYHQNAATGMLYIIEQGYQVFFSNVVCSYSLLAYPWFVIIIIIILIIARSYKQQRIYTQ